MIILLDCISLFLYQVLMNNPLFAGNQQLQEQFRAQLPIFLQQVQHIYLV